MKRVVYSDNQLPMYPYHSHPLQGEDGLLYHYTTIGAAKLILRDMKLKLSDPTHFNDPSDCSLAELSLEDYRGYHKVETSWNSIRIACFTTNWKEGNVWHYGYNHPRMWAQYANNNTGVCIVIDKSALKKENQHIFKSHRHSIRKVRYSNAPERYSNIYKLNPSNFYDKAELYSDELFFCKNLDWKDERETRLIGFEFPDYLSIKDSIAFIVLGAYISIDEYKQLVSIINDVNSVSYKKLGEKSFVHAYYSAGSVEVSDIPSSGKLPELSFLADDVNLEKLGQGVSEGL